MYPLNDNETNALRDLLAPERLDTQEGLDRKVLDNLYRKLKGLGQYTLYIDGAADLQNQIAGIGGAIFNDGEELLTFSEHIGPATNNEAEYKALIRGIKLVDELNIVSINIFADSELVVKQINGQYKVKNPRMKLLHAEAMSGLGHLNGWIIKHIPREQNKIADRLSKAGMKNNGPGSMNRGGAS